MLCGMYVDRRLAGVQAVQTLSRLNRAHPGKDTTYILDFMNGAEEILRAFKTYYETAELEAVTNPNIVLGLKAKLDAGGWYDDFEVDRVASVEVDPKAKQGDLVAAIGPVADRLLKRYKAAQERKLKAVGEHDEKGAQAAQDELAALLLFKNDIGAYQRMYSFLSQMFDYGNTAVEKRFLFFRRLMPLLEFGREREGVDLSKVTLTHHTLKTLRQDRPCDRGRRTAEARAADRGWIGGDQREGEGAACRDHRASERPLRGRTHRRRSARLRE